MPDEITLHSSCVSQVTCVSNDFIDNYMPSSSGEFVKTYLYLLRCVSQSTCRFSVRAAADALNHTEGDIKRALEYWEEKGLIRMEYDSTGSVVGICVLSRPEEKVVSCVSIPTEMITGSDDFSDDTDELTLTDPEDDFEFSDSDFEEIFRMSEQFKGKPLSSREMEIIMSWRQEFGFSVDLIEYLIEMSMNSNHPSFYYMNAIALKWKENGIKTEEQAKLSGSIHSHAYYAVVKAFGIKQRNLSSREQAALSRWTSEYSFSDEMIQEACERALANTGKASFTYADKILKDWYDHNIRSLSDVRKKDTDRAARKVSAAARSSKTTNFQDFTQRPQSSSDISDLEKKLLQ